MATAMQELRGEESAAEESARAFLAELQAYRSANFPTTEEQDKELLRSVNQQGHRPYVHKPRAYATCTWNTQGLFECRAVREEE